MPTQPKLVRFNQNVLAKYQIYNSIFMTLPFDTLSKTVALLPLFYETCKKGFEAGEDPTKTLDSLGLERYCCRRMLLTTVETIQQVIPFYEAIQRRKQEVQSELE